MSSEITLTAFIFPCVLKSNRVHAHTQTFSDMLFILHYMCECWNGSFIFTWQLPIFISLLHSALVFKLPEKIFPFFNANFWSRRRIFPLSWNSIYPGNSFHPTNPLALQHPPPPSPVSKYTRVSFFHGETGRQRLWRLCRCPAKPNRLSTTSYKTAITVCCVFRLCQRTSLDL